MSVATRYLLDTDIFIHIRRGSSREAVRRFERLQVDDAAMSIISYGELIYGAEKSRSRDQALDALRDLVTQIRVLPLPKAAGELYGAMRAELERRGEMIGGNDLWIAAHARAEGLTLVTNNEREFKRITGLKIENWTR